MAVLVKILTGYASMFASSESRSSGSRRLHEYGGGLARFVVLEPLRRQRHAKSKQFAIILGVAAARCSRSALAWQMVGGDSRQRRSPRLFLSSDLKIAPAALARPSAFQLSPVVGTEGHYLYYGAISRPKLQTDPTYRTAITAIARRVGIIGLAGSCFFSRSRVEWLEGFTELLSTRPSSGNRKTPGPDMGALCSTVATASHSSLISTCISPPPRSSWGGFRVLANLEKIEVQFRGARLFPSLSPNSPGAPVLGLWLAIVALPTLPAEYYGERARILLADSRYLESPDAPESRANSPVSAWLRRSEHRTLLLLARRTSRSGIVHGAATWSAIMRRPSPLQKVATCSRDIVCCCASDRSMPCSLGESDALLRVALDGPNFVYVAVPRPHLYLQKKFPKPKSNTEGGETGDATARYWLQRLRRSEGP